MKINHIAITISDRTEIKNFYTDIMGMEPVRDFMLNKDLAHKCFNINQEIPVFVLQKNDLFFEMFISNEMIKKGCDHLCISVENREKLIQKSKAANYKCISTKRAYSDLIFIKDHSGNIFEIKEN